MTSEQRAAIERLREDAETLINSISRNLKRWETWFPNEMAEVDVPRRWLLAMKHYAEIALAEHPADDAEPVTEEWMRSVGFEKHDALWQWSKSNGLKMPSRLVYWPGYRGDGTQWHIDGGPRAKDIYDIPEQPTRGDVRRLCVALGIPLTATS